MQTHLAARLRAAGALVVMISVGSMVVPATALAADPCGTGGNPIACENSKTGSPSSEWEVSWESENIEGFASGFSYNLGDQVALKVRTSMDGVPDSAAYTVDVFRMGYYGGDGARKMPITVTPTRRAQSPCLIEDTTGLVDCGNWAVSASFTIPSTWVSGVYFALLTRTDNGEQNHVPFVVRNDASTSKVLFQTSDTTWQAYNSWGGNSLYAGQPAGRAYKVSYNRPFNTRSSTPWGRDFVFANEYPMIRFLERNGYDLSYTSGIDSDRRGALIRNHTVFLTAGHDEYWSGQQRTNVEAARDAGVNLALFTGNDTYWKTRWENSIDGSGATYRTLVCYKETKDNAKIDSTPWTGTWRDPRFSPPSDGGRPENALTGTVFTVNSGTRAIKVPAADGKMRFWRDTAVAAQADDATWTLPDGTLGYEWNSDLDNGFRPAGLFRLSNATWDVEEKLIDFGSTVAPGTATHSMTMYKAASGARVFSAGTVQWSWGLDNNHDAPGTPPDQNVPMQQATVNLLADLGTQPYSLMTGLHAETASTDTAAPTAVITSPSAGASLGNGDTITVTGTATDAGGGKVAGVEVSTDGGTTWHPATGRGSWTYSYDQRGSGTASIRARAVDDSGNLQGSPASVTVTAACPCVLFGDSETPVKAAEVDTTPTELGVRFTASTNAWVTGVRFLKAAANTGVHTGTLWKADGTKLATATFTNESTSGWQTVTFTDAVPITAGTQYVVSYFAPAGRYYADPEAFAWSSKVSPPLTAPQTADGAPNGVYRSGSTGFPGSTYKGGNYWVDPVVATTEPPDTSAPALVSVDPANGASSVPTSVTPSVTFSEAVVQSSIVMTLRGPGGTAVAGSVGYDTATKVATFTPSAALAEKTTYTLAVSGARDAAGNTMTAYSGTLRTVAPDALPGDCPCSVWDDSTVPGIVSVDDAANLELGVKFRASSAGKITGIRFYKSAANTGPHVGTLWSATGTQLATGTFSGESTTGWQTLTFSTPVEVAANTTYVASYHTTTGYYSATINGFGAAVSKGPLTALRSGEDGPNGVYRYGDRAFPTLGGDANYWVDVVYEFPPDETAPSVTGLSPGSAATGVPTGAGVRVTFSEPVAGGIAFDLRGPGGTAVGGTGAPATGGTQYLFTPSAPLAEGTVYTATVSGAADAAGNTQANPVTWSFTTSGASACPCSLFPSDTVPATAPASDGGAVELGTRWIPSVDGYVTGVRFYKGSGNTGTHVGNLWSSDGSRLATVNFSGESATGWQTAQFPDAVAVHAGQQYTVSYFAPAGHYSADAAYFNAAVTNAPLTAPSSAAAGGNGVYAYGSASRYPDSAYNATNYYVDVRFQTNAPADTRAPQVLGTSPADGRTGVPVSSTVHATFDEALDATGLAMTVTPAGGSAVAGLTTYDATTRTVIFSPSGPLAAGTVHTVSLAGVRDPSGNTAATLTWSFTTGTGSADGCPCTVWPSTATPSVASWNDAAAIELGVKFRASRDGLVRGVRFYKGALNTGVHVGKLYAADGTPLAEATFATETASGWQEVLFASPVAVTADTTYVAAYYAPNGNYAVSAGGLAAAVTAGPLTALADGTDGPNGLYRYGTGGGFPSAGNGTNYWVDAIFE